VSATPIGEVDKVMYHIGSQRQIYERARNAQVLCECVQGGKVDACRKRREEAAKRCHDDDEPFLVLGKD